MSNEAQVCKNCKCWNRTLTTFGDDLPYGVCNSSKFEPNGVHRARNEVKAEKGIHITTGEDFGCIHFWDKKLPGFLSHRTWIVETQ